MHRDNIVLSDLAEYTRGMRSKQFASELHDKGFGTDEAIEMLCLVFGVSHGEARLFLISHPAWAAEVAPHDSRRPGSLPQSYSARGRPSWN